MVKPWVFLFLLVCLYSAQAAEVAGSNDTISSEIQTTDDAIHVEDSSIAEDLGDFITKTFPEPNQHEKAILNRTNGQSISKPIENSSKPNETSSSLYHSERPATNEKPLPILQPPINPPNTTGKNLPINPRSYTIDSEALLKGESSTAKNWQNMTITAKSVVIKDGEDLTQGESPKTVKSDHATKSNKSIIQQTKPTTDNSSKKRKQKRRKASYFEQNANHGSGTPLYRYRTWNLPKQRQHNPYYSRQYPESPRHETSRDIYYRPPSRYENQYPTVNNDPQEFKNVYNSYSSRQSPEPPGYETSWGLNYHPSSRNHKYDEFEPYYSHQYYKPRSYETSRPIDNRPPSRYENHHPLSDKYPQTFNNQFNLDYYNRLKTYYQSRYSGNYYSPTLSNSYVSYKYRV